LHTLYATKIFNLHKKGSKRYTQSNFKQRLGDTMNNNSNWKNKFNYWIFNFQKEVVKTSSIGKKMLTASRTNAHLKETYEELGRLLEKAVENGEVEWDSAKMRALLHTAKACKQDLEEIEKQVHKIKFASGPEDIAIKEEKDKKSSDQNNRL
jgi:hypothetical protein